MADKNPFPGENNTGHIWDDNLRELSNPPPRWWMIAFWLSMAWVLAYAILYPFWPMVNSYTKGIMGWTQMGEYQTGLAEVQAVRAQYEEKITGMTAAEILKDEDLKAYVVASAKVLFGDNCGACHGSGGQGAPTYPMLADDNWLYGGSIETIEQSITNGRKGVMTAHAKVLSEQEVDGLVKAIAAGNPTADPNFLQKGCIACHGMDGKGLQALGAANLTDQIYRFVPVGDETLEDSIRYTILHGVNDATDPKSREAVMPAFGERLSSDSIKKLAVYVHAFGGGQ